VFDVGREGRGPNESVPGSQVVDEFIAGTGDTTNVMQQPVVAPGKSAAKNSSKELRRSSAWGGFGVTEETHDNLRK
jgi:hypothetical protein